MSASCNAAIMHTSLRFEHTHRRTVATRGSSITTQQWLRPRTQMLDVLYLLGTMAFFALMLGYVSFCERLRRVAVASDTDTERRA